MAKSLMEQIADLPEDERREALAGLDMESVEWDWSMWGRPEQIPPDDDSWSVGLFMAGRGSGKTRSAAEWVRLKARDSSQGQLRFLLVARTAADVREVLVEGEALALDTLIPTPTGFTTIGAVMVGDIVIGGDGLPCTVTKVHAILNDRPTFSMNISGATVIADAAHKWVSSTHNERMYETRRPHNTYETVRTTEELLATLKVSGWGSQTNHAIRISPVVGEHIPDLPIQPYTLGLWLGDGTAKSNAITSHDEDQPFVRARIESEGYITTDLKTKFTFGVLTLTTAIKAANVFRNKHIPEQYFYASIDQRMALLQGLVDSDGHVSERGQVEFTNVNKRLAENVSRLAASLGIKNGISLKMGGRVFGNGNYVASDIYRVRFTTSLLIASLPRKADRIKKLSPEESWRYVKDITPSDSVPVRCIEVDSSDRTFLITDQYIRTHNSGIMACSPPSEMPEYKPSIRRLIWPNGNQAFCTSADEPDSLRGVQARLALDTPLLTQNRGWQTMGSVALGDIVFDENGAPTNVTGVHPVHPNPESYRITFSDGTHIDADEGHRWGTLTAEDRKNPILPTWGDSPVRITTQEMKNTLHVLRDTQQELNHFIPAPTAGGFNVPNLTQSLGVSGRFVVSVAPIAPVAMRCIMVDAPSHLYLAGEGLVSTSNSYSWGDEIAAWRQTPDGAGMTAWDNLRVATRLGRNPQVLATTTPKRVPILFDLIAEEAAGGKVWLTTGSTFDNASNLSGAYIDAISGLYEGTDKAQQELYGEMLGAAEGALWTDEILNEHRTKMPAYTPMRIIGVDPSVAENPGDECGIVALGSTSNPDLYNRHAWVLEDASVKGAPHVWAAEVVRMANKWGCPVVAEVNQGGALVASAIHQIDPTVVVLTVHSKVGKKLRAEPVTLAYQQGRVHHVGRHQELEDQMIQWLPEGSGKSPDRIDALVHGLTALLISPPPGFTGSRMRATPVRGRPIKTRTNPTAAVLRTRNVGSANAGKTFKLR